MVVRKASIPYPASPPPPPPPESSTQQSHHQLDSTDIPPVPAPPAPVSRSHAASNFEEMGNPWQDDYSNAHGPHGHIHSHSHSPSIPDLLKPGTNKPPTEPTSNLHPLLDVLRPGWSGEATPRSSLDSDRSPEREWWDDDAVDDHHDEHGHERDEPDANGTFPEGLHVVNDTAAPQPSSAVKRKPLPASHPPQHELLAQPTGDVEFGSNNPFRRPSETFLQPPPDRTADVPSESSGKTREGHPHPLRSSPSTDQMGQLKLNHPSEEKIAFHDPPTTAPPPPPQQAPPPIPHLQAPLLPSQPQHVNNPNFPPAHQRLSPVPSLSSFDPAKQTVSTDDLLDRGNENHHLRGAVSLGEELRAIPNAAPSPRPSVDTGEVSLLDDDDLLPARPPRPPRQESEDMYSPPPGPPPSHVPPLKPPRPAVVTSEADLAKMRQQRNETYQIKHFNWYDLRTSRMRRSSMLTQNKNGPCPLLALVNALILGATEDMQAALDDALRLREQVSLGLIIETLMDELIAKASAMPGLELPEIDELNRFLMRLRTGMNANPRFVPQPKDAPNLMDADTPTTPTVPQPESLAGTFERTQDINLYSSFRVKLLHGWLPRPGDQAAKAFSRSAQTYEDAQAVQFGEEELEYKLSNGGLTAHEQQVWEDITSVKQFFQAYPTQLTPYGLSAVQDTLQPGEFAILFRNDHFSTIYKHPRDQRLYTLITDAGYADRDEIIWESLEDINGARSEFFSGDFTSVNHADTRHAMPHSSTDVETPGRPSNQALLSPNNSYQMAPALTPQAQQEQHDADFAMALQLQEEEEQRMRQARAGRGGRGGAQGGAGIRPSPPNRPQNRRSGQGNIPIPLRSNPGGEVRPVIPPRNQNAPPRNPAVNRPADADAVDAPPAYEEAARQTPYNPPIGSPLHPSSSTDLPIGRASTSTSSVNAQGQTTGYTGAGGAHASREQRPGMGYIPGQAGTGHRRRTSAYGDNNANYDLSPDYSAGTMGPTYAFMTPTETDGRRRSANPHGDGRDRECVVM